MSNDFVTMQSIQQRVTDKIKAEFANLIPDDVWQRMVDETVKEFITDVPEIRDHYNHIKQQARLSPLKGLIQQALNDMAKEHVKNALNEFGVKNWNNFGEEVASAAVKKLVEENFASLLSGVQKNIMEVLVMNAVSALRQGRF